MKREKERTAFLYEDLISCQIIDNKILHFWLMGSLGQTL